MSTLIKRIPIKLFLKQTAYKIGFEIGVVMCMWLSYVSIYLTESQKTLF